ncbi:MAG: hypothetical protein WBQ24_03680, partial [Xanthobacteraceae bacterium]
MEHDLFGKPVSTFPDHALEPRPFVTVAAEILHGAATVGTWTIETLGFETAAVALAEPAPALKARMMRPKDA